MLGPLPAEERPSTGRSGPAEDDVKVCEVIVVDDGSPAEERRLMLEAFPRFVYVFKGVNGINKGTVRVYVSSDALADEPPASASLSHRPLPRGRLVRILARLHRRRRGAFASHAMAPSHQRVDSCSPDFLPASDVTRTRGLPELDHLHDQRALPVVRRRRLVGAPEATASTRPTPPKLPGAGYQGPPLVGRGTGSGEPWNHTHGLVGSASPPGQPGYPIVGGGGVLLPPDTLRPPHGALRRPGAPGRTRSGPAPRRHAFRYLTSNSPPGLGHHQRPIVQGLRTRGPRRLHPGYPGHRGRVETAGAPCRRSPRGR